VAADATVDGHVDDLLLGVQRELVAGQLEPGQPRAPRKRAKSASVPSNGASPSLTSGVDGSSTGVSSGGE
jgi:hypothetical protein